MRRINYTRLCMIVSFELKQVHRVKDLNRVYTVNGR